MAASSDIRAWSWAETAIGFRPEFLDFDRGIRVGNLEPHERITRILKGALEEQHRQPFVTERWGRGVFWQWIGFLPRANREAKPVSSDVSFGCAKFFVTVDTDEREFKCGLQVERGYLRASGDERAWRLAPDWDWHRLTRGLRSRAPFDRELRRLVRDGFHVQAGGFSERHHFTRATLPGPLALRRLLDRAPAREWAGFQLYYPLAEADVRASSGRDLVETMLAVFDEVTPAMNACMQIRLERHG